jgi:hypothetical protein
LKGHLKCTLTQLYFHLILINKQLFSFTQNNHFCDSTSPRILFWPAHKPWNKEDSDLSRQKSETWPTLHVPQTWSHNMKGNWLHHNLTNSTQTADWTSNSTYRDAPAYEMHGDMITRWNMICHQHFWIFVPHFSIFLLHNDAQHNTQGAQHKTVTQHSWTTDIQEYGPLVDQYNRALPSKVTGIQQHDKHQTET